MESKLNKECLLHQRKLVSTIVSLTLPLLDGLKKVRLDTIELMEVSIDTGSIHQSNKLKSQLKTILQIIELLLHTQEYPQDPKKTILIDKLNISLRTIPSPPSYLISARVLISTAGGCNPYLKKSLWEQYPLLLFLIKIVCLDLDLSGLNLSASQMIQNSLFSMTKTNHSNPQEMNLLKTYLQSLIVSPPKCTLTENIAEPQTLYKTEKTKVIFSDQNKSLGLKEYLRDMSDLYNVSWNKGVSLVKSLSKPYIRGRTKYIKKNSKPRKPLKIKKTKGMSKNKKRLISREIQKSKRRIKFRKFKCSTFITNNDLKNLGKQIRNKEFRNKKQIELCKKLKYNDKTVESAFSRIQSIIKAQRTKKQWFFDLKVRSRKNNRIVTFNARDYKGIKMTFGRINGLDEISGEFKFLFNKQEKQWYLLTQKEFEQPTTVSETPMTCSLDPGVREFQKVFSLNEGCVYTIGTKEDINKISKLKVEMEKAQGRLKKIVPCDYEKIVYRRIRQKLKRLRDMKATKVFNKRKDAHWKLSSFLTDKFDIIILPDFTTQSMMSKQSGLYKTTRKEMRDWGHYMFKEKLRWMCIKKNKTLVDSKEYYTSKTCCCCLTMTTSIGSGKNFNCPNCPNNIDRDINGAINNFMIMISN